MKIIQHIKLNIRLLVLFVIFWTSQLTAFAQADLEPHPNSRACEIQLIDARDATPLSGAHVCVELNNGDKSYVVSDQNGKARLHLLNDEPGVIVISSVGYISTYLPCQSIDAGSVIPLSADVFSLDQVVVTGSNTPTPVDSSIYKVKVISRERIEQSGAVALNELLLNEANIRVNTNLVLGSQIEMLGMKGGQNVKIMIDGVPVIGRLGGNIDLSQINMANVKQVEIIEGPMSVIYGNNALAGTINIITNNKYYHDFSGQVNTYLESVGRYAGNANANTRFGQHNFGLEGGYEYFSGVDFDKSTRAMEWKPKKQHRLNASYGFDINNWNLNAKFNLYSDELLYKSDLSGTRVYDNYYFTDRYDYSLGLNKNWGDNRSLNIISSYNIYERSAQALNKDLSTLEEKWGEKKMTQKATQRLSRAIYSHTLVPEKLSFQSGIDLNYEEMTGPRIVDGAQSIGDYAAFLNVGYDVSSKLTLQPGLRYSYNTKYSAPVVYSVNAKWHFASAWNWRLSLAKGFRAPSVKELFMDFVNASHNISGNPDLEAEHANNINTSVDYTLRNVNHNWRITASGYYSDVSNMIALMQSEDSDKYLYQNISEYQSTGTNIEINYGFRSLLKLRTGYGLTGRYNTYTEANGSDKFNISHDAFAGINLVFAEQDVTFAADYKYNGVIPYFFSEEGVVMEGKQAAYHTMDTSISKRFWSNKFKATAGAKNLFDVTSANRVSTGSAHSDRGGLPISYGRSYFLNLVYKFNYSK